MAGSLWHVAAAAVALVGPLEVSAADCIKGATCDSELNGTVTSSLLMSRKLVSKVRTALSCSALSLEGNFEPEASCANVAVGESCLVSCAAGFTGDAMRYFCFPALAEAGRPPAALHPPNCFSSSESTFSHGKVMPLLWGERGCVECPLRKRRVCTQIADAAPDDERCTKFLVDREQNRLSLADGEEVFVYIARGPQLGTWSYIDNDDFAFKPEPHDTVNGAEQLCVNSDRGTICLQAVDTPKSFFDTAPDTTLLEPAMTALAEGNGEAFMKQLLALQTCRARLDTGLPDEFWEWLAADTDLTKALLSTFPSYPGQIRMFHAIRELVGKDRFDSLGMGSFAVSLSYLNRFRDNLQSPVDFPKGNYERNGLTYLEGEEERIKQEMIAGDHCRLQSNECRDLHRCCGTPDTWKFKWPRDPTPSIEDWIQFWLEKTADHGDALWSNPLSETPWIFGVYLWPSPLAECEWVHKKLIEGEDMEGRWYYYKSDFHVNVCEGGDYHPDSIQGIAVYGGVCGRMSALNWRKSSCMGRPATQKGEPGHSAGFMFTRKSAMWTPLNIITNVSDLVTLNIAPPPERWVTLELAKNDEEFPDEPTTCLACKNSKTCTFEPAGSDSCTHFRFDLEAEHPVIRTSSGQCMTMRPESGSSRRRRRRRRRSGDEPAPPAVPRPDSYRCWNPPGENQEITMGDDGIAVMTGERGTMRFRATDVPKEKLVWGQKFGCVKCRSSNRECEVIPSDSSDCTLFRFNEDTGLLHPQGIAKCIDMMSDGQPGIYRCNSASSYQKFEVLDDGTLHQDSRRGTVYFNRVAAKEIESERGRCLSCASSAYRTCSFVAADSTECTEFFYDPKTHLVQMEGSKRARCLAVYSGSVAGTESCSPTEHNRVVSAQDGKLTFSSSRGTIHAHVPNGAELPAEEQRFRFDGYHEIQCPQSRCHWTSVLGLGSKKEERWTARHKEAALSMVEAWNNYETKGNYPTAYDEARLAASVAYALRRDSLATDEELEPIVAWALQRNPGLYDAWELAAEFPGGLSSAGIPDRESLPYRQWFNQLELLSLDTKGTAAADKFAHKHLVDGAHLAKFPRLRKSLVGRLCGALSQGVLQKLGEASAQCRQLQLLSRGQGFDSITKLLLLEDHLSDGNMPTPAFEESWEALANLVSADKQSERVSKVVEDVLESITVAYVNERSQAFYAEHGRLVLRAPAAYMLQLAGRVLPKEDRERILGEVRQLLQSPESTRIFASPGELKDAFLEWASRDVRSSSAHERVTMIDDINGFGPDDDVSPEIAREMMLDRDEQMEQGSPLLRPDVDEDGSRRDFDVDVLLRTLLNLDDEQEEGEESEAALPQVAKSSQSVKGKSTFETPTSTELLRMCMDHELA